MTCTTDTHDPRPSRSASPCPACGAESLERGPAHARCTGCGHRTSDLELDLSRPSPLDDEGLKDALRTQRRREHDALLDAAAARAPVRRVLDVGCATGEFLNACRDRGLEAVGVEPDPRLAARARRAGHRVEEVLFEDLPDEVGRFDLISFNDVLEHIPDVRGTLSSVPRLLAPGGMLAVTVPSADGVFFRLASGLERLGVAGPMRRLWQADFPSPHLHYFSPASLERLAEQAGLRPVWSAARSPVSADGLWRRIRADQSVSLPYAFAVWSAVRASLPVLERLPKDISVQLFMPND